MQQPLKINIRLCEIPSLRFAQTFDWLRDFSVRIRN